MLTDIEIAQTTPMKPITDIARTAGIDESLLEPYGKYKAKLDARAIRAKNVPDGKLILVTAITPTPAGEGKTTTTIGLADGLSRIGKDVTVALREPSLGPVFGVKGGAAGGGYAQVVPMEDINLHFTGDFHDGLHFTLLRDFDVCQVRHILFPPRFPSPVSFRAKQRILI